MILTEIIPIRDGDGDFLYSISEAYIHVMSNLEVLRSYPIGVQSHMMNLSLAGLRSFLHLSAISDEYREIIFQLGLELSASGELAHGIYHDLYGEDKDLTTLFNALQSSDEPSSLLVMNRFRRNGSADALDVVAFWSLAMKNGNKKYFGEVAGLRKSILGKAESGYEKNLRRHLVNISKFGERTFDWIRDIVLDAILTGREGYELWLQRSLAEKYPDVVEWIIDARAYFGQQES